MTEKKGAPYNPPDVVQAWNDAIAAAEERGRRRGVEEERKRAEAEAERVRNATIEILTAPRCKCGRFSMSGAHRDGLLMLGGTCGKDVLHAPDRCGDPPAALASRDSGNVEENRDVFDVEREP